MVGKRGIFPVSCGVSFMTFGFLYNQYFHFDFELLQAKLHFLHNDRKTQSTREFRLLSLFYLKYYTYEVLLLPALAGPRCNKEAQGEIVRTLIHGVNISPLQSISRPRHRHRSCTVCLRVQYSLRALVYHILPSTSAVFSYAIGSKKRSANEQFFVGAQTVVSLLQTTRIISDICFITDHVAYASK